MLNWPIPGGTSAHFVGGAFAAIVLGPHLGALAVALVVAVQALVFGDGGVIALGANVWNMAIVEAYVGYAVYRLLAGRSELLASVAAGWVGITLAALSAALQLGLSPTFDYELLTVVSVMVGGHAVLSIGAKVVSAGASSQSGNGRWARCAWHRGGSADACWYSTTRNDRIRW